MIAQKDHHERFGNDRSKEGSILLLVCDITHILRQLHIRIPLDSALRTGNLLTRYALSDERRIRIRWMRHRETLCTDCVASTASHLHAIPPIPCGILRFSLIETASMTALPITSLFQVPFASSSRRCSR